MAENDPRLELTYLESVRALDQQAAALDGLRTRAGVLLSAAAIASSLFGGQIVRDGSLTCWSWVAIGCFVLSAAGCLAVLWPRGEWYFVNRAPDLLKRWVDHEPLGDELAVDRMRREVSEFNHENWQHNQWRLGQLHNAYRWASVFLAAEVGAWLIDLALR